MEYGHFCCGSSGVLLRGHFRLDQSFSSYFSVARDMRIRFHQWKGYHADPGGLKGTLWEKTSLHDTLASLGHKVRIWATETYGHREYKKKQLSLTIGQHSQNLHWKDVLRQDTYTENPHSPHVSHRHAWAVGLLGSCAFIQEKWKLGQLDCGILYKTSEKKIDRVYDREQQCPFIERVSGWGAMCNEERA